MVTTCLHFPIGDCEPTHMVIVCLHSEMKDCEAMRTAQAHRSSRSEDDENKPMVSSIPISSKDQSVLEIEPGQNRRCGPAKTIEEDQVQQKWSAS